MEKTKKRESCPRCQSPITRCLCDFAPTNLTAPTPLIILRHKDEKNHYLNTAKILELSLKNIKVFDGEIFSPDLLNSFPEVKNWILLFPTEDAKTCTELKEKNIPITDCGILLIDGTWKKAKKIFYLNSFLQQLPRIKLSHHYPSQYELRKCGKENFLSTIEAYAYFLKELNNGEEQISDELIGRFKTMIDLQKKRALLPEEIRPALKKSNSN